MSNEQNIVYRLYENSDADELAVLLSGVFSKYDPPAFALGVTQPEFEEFVRLFCSRADKQQLTIVARCADTGEMCGALLTEDAATDLPDGIGALGEKFDPIFDILGQLDHEYQGDRAIDPGHSMHLLLLGVSRRFSGQGVAHRLVAECLRNGIARGYRLAVTEATNPTSQHIFRKQDFVERVRRSYEAHEFDGRRPFASIADYGGPILMDKSLSTDGQR